MPNGNRNLYLFASAFGSRTNNANRIYEVGEVECAICFCHSHSIIWPFRFPSSAVFTSLWHIRHGRRQSEKGKCESIENNLRRYLQHLSDYFCVFYLFLWSVQHRLAVSISQTIVHIRLNSNIHSISDGIWDETFFAYYSELLYDVYNILHVPQINETSIYDLQIVNDAMNETNFEGMWLMAICAFE